MEIREFAGDIILTAVLVISALLLIHRQWDDPIATAGAAVMMVSLSGLLITLHRRIARLERALSAYQHTTRANLEEISEKMLQKYEITSSHIDGVVNDISRRIYR